MSDLNRLTVIGNLTRDPEIKQINETQLCNFAIANNRTYSHNGERKEEALFLDCELWGKSAEIFEKYMRKGSRVSLDGRLRQSSWDDENGKKKYRIKLHVDNFQFLDKKQSDTPASNTPADSDIDKDVF